MWNLVGTPVFRGQLQHVICNDDEYYYHYFLPSALVIPRDIKNYATQCKEAGMAVSHSSGQSCRVVKLQ